MNLSSDPTLEAILRRWALRAVFAMGSQRTSKPGLQGLPLETWHLFSMEEPDFSKVSPEQVVASMRAMLAREEKRRSTKRSPLIRNAQRLAVLLGLSEIEHELLAFATALNISPSLQGPFERFKPVSARHVHQILSAVIDRPVIEIRRALDGRAPLAHCGLLRVKLTDGYRALPLELRDGMEDVLLSEGGTRKSLLGSFFSVAKPPTVTEADMAHLAPELELMVKLAREAVCARTRGVNLLLHGRPGTGKSELARLVAKRAGLDLYEVSVADPQGDSLDSAARLSSLRMCQHMLGRSAGALVLFDEVEDVFQRASDFFGLKKKSGNDKGWMNKLLDDAPVPSIWIANHVDHIDPAFLRRFDLVVEVRSPPRAARRRVLDRHTRGLSLSGELLNACAADDRIVPGLVQKAARVSRLVGKDAASRERAFEQALGASLAVLHGKGLHVDRKRPGVAYDYAFVNASEDAEKLARAFAKTRRGTALLYGPPGTGKTAFVQHLAKSAGLPLVTKRASDLLSMWVGGTEQLLADAFKDAKKQEAILFIDEGDSFLRDREGATRSWEVTQVNELLTQMESFEGLFFLATNLVHELDQAAFRRFALKVRFEPLKLAQREELFGRTLARFAVDDDRSPSITASALAKLDALTPGDYAAVERKYTLLGEAPTAAVLVAALAEEHKFKKGATKTVGFAS